MLSQFPMIKHTISTLTYGQYELPRRRSKQMIYIYIYIYIYDFVLGGCKDKADSQFPPKKEKGRR